MKKLLSIFIACLISGIAVQAMNEVLITSTGNIVMTDKVLSPAI